ncbi:hypothetical protein ACFVAJ_17090 [Agromyces sp. NPDC057679]|uniref:hypothetical protein n=1 Tax=Agromyces sp. NPDC057679 TaxID=3346207 RepID=UPI00366BF6D3
MKATTGANGKPVRPPLSPGMTVALPNGAIAGVTRRAPNIGRPGIWWKATKLDGSEINVRDGEVPVHVSGAGWV